MEEKGKRETAGESLTPKPRADFEGSAGQAPSTLSRLNGNATFFHFLPIFSIFFQKCLRQKMAMIMFLPYNLNNMFLPYNLNKKTQKMF